MTSEDFYEFSKKLRAEFDQHYISENVKAGAYRSINNCLDRLEESEYWFRRAILHAKHSSPKIEDIQ